MNRFMIVSVTNGTSTIFLVNRATTVSVPRLTLPRRATPVRTTWPIFLLLDARNCTSTLSPTLTGVLPGTFAGDRMLTVAVPAGEGVAGLPGLAGAPLLVTP